MNYFVSQQLNKRLNNITTKTRGFAMLFTVLIVTLILSIAIGISNVTLKQTILSSLAKDSQISFYQADTAVECGLFYDTANAFPIGTAPGGAMSPITCGEDLFYISQSLSDVDYLVYTQSLSDQTKPCSTIIFDKKTLISSGIKRVQGRGYNICSVGLRQVERALEARY